MSMSVLGCDAVGFAWYIFFRDVLWVVPPLHSSSTLVRRTCHVPPACVQTCARLFSAYQISVMFLALLCVWFTYRPKTPSAYQNSVLNLGLQCLSNYSLGSECKAMN